MSDLDNFLKLASKVVLDAYVSAQMSVNKKYQNIHHIMKSDVEVLEPSDNEIYTFNKDDWNITDYKDRVIIVKKKVRK